MTPLELIAHDLICIVKYGSPGGSASANDIKHVSAYLARLNGKLPEPERPKPPSVTIKPPAVRIAPPPAVIVKLP